MGHPVVHFEGSIDAANPMGYGIVQREENLSDEGIGFGGGVAGGPGGYEGTSRSTCKCPTWRRLSPRPSSSVALA
jgi:hypothetical protein